MSFSCPLPADQISERDIQERNQQEKDKKDGERQEPFEGRKTKDEKR